MVWVLILNLQKVGLLRGREEVVYWCTPIFLLFTFSLVFLLIFLPFLLFLFLFLFLFFVFCFFLFFFWFFFFFFWYSFIFYFLCFSLLFFLLFIFFYYCSWLSLIYRLPLWDLPLLHLNRFWFLTGIPLGLPTNLLAVQPLPLLKVCFFTTLHFQTKLLVLFLTSLCSCFTHVDKD